MKKLVSIVVALLLLSEIYAQQNHTFSMRDSYATLLKQPTNIPDSALINYTVSFYNQWKLRYVKPACSTGEYYIYFDEAPRFKWFKKSKICVSEGQGYGMIITADMAGFDPDAHKQFDGLFRFYKDHTSNSGANLMAWQQVSGCKTSSLDSSSASDGDIDIAYSLLLANKLWGSNGDIDYLGEAKKMIHDIADYEVNRKSDIVMLGDWLKMGDVSDHITRSSDFMPDHFRDFYKVTGDSTWLKVIDKEYAIFENIQARFSKNTGLIPDFIETNNHNPRPARKQILESDYDGDYYYNACRVPLRLSVDYLVNDDPRAKSIIDKINFWMIKHSEGDPDLLHSGYKLSGKDIKGNDYSCPAFVAPLLVSASTDPQYENWLNNLWTAVTGMSFEKNRYYDNTLKMMSLIILSGHYLTYS